jgi:hypothetical protein
MFDSIHEQVKMLPTLRVFERCLPSYSSRITSRVVLYNLVASLRASICRLISCGLDAPLNSSLNMSSLAANSTNIKFSPTNENNINNIIYYNPPVSEFFKAKKSNNSIINNSNNHQHSLDNCYNPSISNIKSSNSSCSATSISINHKRSREENSSIIVNSSNVNYSFQSIRVPQKQLLYMNYLISPSHRLILSDNVGNIESVQSSDGLEDRDEYNQRVVHDEKSSQKAEAATEAAPLTHNLFHDRKYIEFYSSAEAAKQSFEQLKKAQPKTYRGLKQRILEYQLNSPVRIYCIPQQILHTLFNDDQAYKSTQMQTASSTEKNEKKTCSFPTSFTPNPSVPDVVDKILSGSDEIIGFTVQNSNCLVLSSSNCPDILKLIDDDKHSGVNQQFLTDMFAKMCMK